MKAHVFTYILVISALAGASLACQALSSIPAGSTSSTQEANAPSIPQVIASSIPSVGGSSILQDDFSDSGSGWGTGTDTDSSVEYVDGGLNMKIFKANFFTWSNPGKETYDGTHLEVTVKNQNGKTRTGFGVMCNQQVTDSSYYYFAITPVGEYVIGKSAVGKQDVFLTNNDAWGTSDLIAKNAPSYRIGADCAPGKLVLYVDGHQIDSASDTEYSKGNVGLFLWSGDDPTGEVTYDDFVMTALK